MTPGESYFASGYGNLGKYQQASLVCQDFAGRGLLARVVWHSPSNILGSGQCPYQIGEAN